MVMSFEGEGEEVVFVCPGLIPCLSLIIFHKFLGFVVPGFIIEKFKILGFEPSFFSISKIF